MALRSAPSQRFQTPFQSTIDTIDGCTTTHSGTSAAAPLAAGILALALHANAKLSWRDVQHLAVWSSEPAPLLNEAGWYRNGNGLWVNDKFGFGLMNADSMTKYAAEWTNVPPMLSCTSTFPDVGPSELFVNKKLTLSLKTDACEGSDNEINYLESVQVVLNVKHRRRGDLAVWLESPSGLFGSTRTKLLRSRKLDNSTEGLNEWPLMSLHTWSEDPSGEWKVIFNDETGEPTDKAVGRVKNVTLVFFGTKDKPAHYDNPRDYDMNYNTITDENAYIKLLENSKNLAKKALDDHERIKRTSGDKNAETLETDLEVAQRAIDALEDLHDHEFRHKK